MYYFLSLQPAKIAPAFLIECFLQLFIFSSQFLIFLPQSEDLVLEQIDPAFHCLIQDASAWINGSGLLFHGPVYFSSYDWVLIKESSGSASHLHKLGNRYSLALFQ